LRTLHALAALNAQLADFAVADPAVTMVEICTRHGLTEGALPGSLTGMTNGLVAGDDLLAAALADIARDHGLRGRRLQDAVRRRARDIDWRRHALSASAVHAACEEEDGDTVLFLPGGRALRIGVPLATVLGWLDGWKVLTGVSLPPVPVPVRCAARHPGALVGIARARQRVIAIRRASGDVALVPCLRPDLRPPRVGPPRDPLPLR
jgi:hypothetical protein